MYASSIENRTFRSVYYKTFHTKSGRCDVVDGALVIRVLSKPTIAAINCK